MHAIIEHLLLFLIFMTKNTRISRVHDAYTVLP